MMRKRDRIRRKTREQVEKLMDKAKRTWLSMNEVLKNGKWRNEAGEEED